MLGWSAGCATGPRPLVDSGYAARAYTPGRIAVLPPDVFVVLDQVGDNDPVKSAAIGQAVSAETMRAIDRSLRSRGYDVNLLPRWDGVYGPDGAPVPGGEALEGLARSIIYFASSTDGAREGAIGAPPRVAPELAAQVGAATQADAVLYINVKGVVTTPGRQTATILTGVFIVVIVAAIILMLASQKGGGGGHGIGHGGAPSHVNGGNGGWRAAPPAGGSSFRPASWHGGGAPMAVGRRRARRLPSTAGAGADRRWAGRAAVRSTSAAASTSTSSSRSTSRSTPTTAASPTTIRSSPATSSTSR